MAALVARLDRRMSFSLAVTDRELYVSIGAETLTGAGASRDRLTCETSVLLYRLVALAADSCDPCGRRGIQARRGWRLPLGGEPASALFRALLVLTVIIVTARLWASVRRSASQR